MSIKHKIKKYLSITTIVLIVCSCETVVDVPPPEFTPSLVAHGFFTSDSLWAVKLTKSIGFTEAGSPDDVDDASVEIWNNEVLIANPTRRDSGLYVATGKPNNPGSTFTLRASSPTAGSVVAHDELPSPVRIVRTAEIHTRQPDSLSRRNVYTVELDLIDDASTDDYYGIALLQVRWRLNRKSGAITPLPAGFFQFESDDEVLGESPFDILSNEKSIYYEAFFSDDLINGTTHTISFDLQYDDPSPKAEIIVQRAFAVVLLSVSKDFYSYWTTAGDQLFTNQNPFSEPLDVHSNVENGLGIFAGFEYQIIPLTQAGAPSMLANEACLLIGPYLPVCGVPAF